MPTPISVLVTGDLVVDHHIYEGTRFTLRDQSGRGTQSIDEIGGAALTHGLIEAVFKADFAERHVRWKANRKGPAPAKAECRIGSRLPRGGGKTRQAESLVGTASWSPGPKAGSKDLFWRVSKAFGYSARDSAARVPGPATDLSRGHDILVLDDAGDRFRNKDHAGVWHLPKNRRALPEWIVLKLGGPVGRGDLWDRLMDCEPRRRLIVVVSARLLRRHDVRLSRGLSWERTVEHLVSELKHNPSIQPLRYARHLIVSFEGDGAVWIDSSKPSQRARVVFDPAHTEGEWASRITGDAFSYQTCLVASLVQTLASIEKKGAEPDLPTAIGRGLSAMRNLREEGHGIAVTSKGEVHPGSGFPDERLAKEILHPSHRFVSATVPASLSDLSSWSILASLQNPTAVARPLFGFARQLVIQGHEVLDHVPHLRIGQLVTAGRQEMETLRSLRRIMVAYGDKNNPGKKPLCIGVFGEPGSGKSFGVEQLAVGVFGEPDKKKYDGWMEFNLSQFDKPADLIGAFHQVRDRVLQGLLPVVFWDEFDAKDYDWLRFLLAPMQDGRFQEGQVTHTLGKCVFIFAGGTASTFDKFGPAKKDPAFRHFKLAKGPDFKSRLDGYLNVLGPDSSGRGDVFYPVRRALMIRNLLGCAPEDRLDIDGGLLTALLEATSYKHGARSLGKVLEPLTAARKLSPSLRRSQLPAPNQLSLHVDTDEFHGLCSRDLPFKTDEVTDKLAPAIHETWREIARKEGWLNPKYDVPFEELPPDIKRSNEAAARRIPDILALVGLKVAHRVATLKQEKAVRNHLELHLELLAEEEHKGWMANAESEGWTFAELRNDGKRHHNCLRPFHELRPLDKEKDRSSVRHFPDFVRLAGFRIVFIGRAL